MDQIKIINSITKWGLGLLPKFHLKIWILELRIRNYSAIWMKNNLHYKEIVCSFYLIFILLNKSFVRNFSHKTYPNNKEFGVQTPKSVIVFRFNQ